MLKFQKLASLHRQLLRSNTEIPLTLPGCTNAVFTMNRLCTNQTVGHDDAHLLP